MCRTGDQGPEDDRYDDALVGHDRACFQGVEHDYARGRDAAPAAAGMERFFERSAELADDTRAAGAFKKFASDAGMEVVEPPLAQSSPS